MGVILVTSRSFDTGRAKVQSQLMEAGHTVIRGDPHHHLDALREALSSADAWIAGTGRIEAAHLAIAPRLQIIARYGVGVDAVDRYALASHGVLLTNTPGANSDAVADHALGLMLALLRGTLAADRRVRRGDWSASAGRELGGMTVGIVGYGRIGQGVARRLRGFGARFIAVDPFLDPSTVTDTELVDEPLEIARRCDLVSLHSPGGAVIVDERWLTEARPGMLVVNTARGDLIDESAVAEALRRNHLAGFAADALAGEHANTPSPLLDADLADRVILTPHLGAQTTDAIDKMSIGAAQSVLDALAGRSPAHLIAPGGS